MGSLQLAKHDVFIVDAGDPHQTFAIKRKALNRFDAHMLGLGELTRRSVAVEAACAIFDPEGFTDFCKQVDPHLAVPDFMSRFLEWLFAEVKRNSVGEEIGGANVLYTRLPFFAKFMGDGVMFLWDTTEIATERGVFNLVSITRSICDEYSATFYPQARRMVVNPPRVLRCGLARGRVYSVGDGSDYVGPCINIAARLQKLVPGVRCCVSRRGFDATRHTVTNVSDALVVKKIAIRGIGEDGLVYLWRDQFEALDDVSSLHDP